MLSLTEDALYAGIIRYAPFRGDLCAGMVVVRLRDRYEVHDVAERVQHGGARQAGLQLQSLDLVDVRVQPVHVARVHRQLRHLRLALVENRLPVMQYGPIFTF